MVQGMVLMLVNVVLSQQKRQDKMKHRPFNALKENEEVRMKGQSDIGLTVWLRAWGVKCFAFFVHLQAS